MSTDINIANLSDNSVLVVTSPGQPPRVTPWTQVVRGGESEATASVPLSPSSVSQSSLSTTFQSTLLIVEQAEEESSDGGGGGSGNAGKKPAWNKPSNGSAVAAVEPMMGTHAWPALSETTRGSSAKSSSDSLKGLSDRSSSVSQGTATANLTSPKQVNDNGNPNSAPNLTAPTRQRSMKRNGGNTSNGSLSQPSATQRPVVEGSLNNPSHRDHTQKSGFASHGGNDHPQQRGSFRNRNGNSHPRGDGSHHHNYGSRRDQDRGSQDWNAHRHFNGRDGHMQAQRVGQRFMRHPPPPPPPPAPSSSQFFAPPTVRPFGSPIGFAELASPVYYVAAPPPETLRGGPFVAPISPHALFFTGPDPQLHSRIVNQIDYYFSNENLIKDTYLRQNMDEQGWVPIKLIAGFKKVSLLTDNIQLILDAVRSSTVVEVQGDKIRKRNDWMKWIMPPGQFSNVSSPQSQGKSSHDTLEWKTSNAAATDQLNTQGVPDGSISARNTN